MKKLDTYIKEEKSKFLVKKHINLDYKTANIYKSIDFNTKWVIFTEPEQMDYFLDCFPEYKENEFIKQYYDEYKNGFLVRISLNRGYKLLTIGDTSIDKLQFYKIYREINIKNIIDELKKELNY